MNEKISLLITEINKKISDLKNNLDLEIEKNKSLEVKIQKVEKEENELKEINHNLKEKLENIMVTNNQLLNQQKDQNPIENRDLEIDFLVREIDNCISQIKDNL